MKISSLHFFNSNWRQNIQNDRVFNEQNIFQQLIFFHLRVPVLLKVVIIVIFNQISINNYIHHMSPSVHWPCPTSKTPARRLSWDGGKFKKLKLQGSRRRLLSHIVRCRRFVVFQCLFPSIKLFPNNLWIAQRTYIAQPYKEATVPAIWDPAAVTQLHPFKVVPVLMFKNLMLVIR